LKILLVFLFGLIAATVQAAPFLVSDPYPTDKPQPDTFLVFIGTATTPVISAAVKAADGSVSLKYDLTAIGVGPKTIKVRAKNVWGESVDSDPFVFSAGNPAAPGKLGLSAN
jgi:hypothetical protein